MASPLHLNELMVNRSSELLGANCTALVQVAAFAPQGCHLFSFDVLELKALRAVVKQEVRKPEAMLPYY